MVSIVWGLTKVSPLALSRYCLAPEGDQSPPQRLCLYPSTSPLTAAFIQFPTERDLLTASENLRTGACQSVLMAFSAQVSSGVNLLTKVMAASPMESAKSRIPSMKELLMLLKKLLTLSHQLEFVDT